MPVITIDRDRFCRFIGRRVSIEEMTKWLPWLGLDIEEIGDNYVKVEYNPNRMDFSSQAGIARAFKGLLGWETGLPRYKAEDGEISLIVDPSVENVRPYIVCAVIRGINLDEEDVKELMEMQEDLHWGVGRDRRKSSIGVHDLDSVNPPFTYKAVPPDSISFIPLGKNEKMTLREILEEHEKGIAYKHLVNQSPLYPVIVDRDLNVLSFPPIINGELTRVTSSTRNLFIEVTGLDRSSVNKSLNILVTALHDMGGRIESVSVKYPNREEVTPNLTVKKMTLKTDYANRLLGLRLKEDEIIECLRKSRLDAEASGRGILEVSIPPYRIDILHMVDLVEEVAIGYGYYNFEPTIPQTVTVGSSHTASIISNKVRLIMIGLGFTEVMNFILTNEDIQYNRMRIKKERPIRLANPKSSEYSIVRDSILPCLMKNLSENKHESYPQNLFEVSDVIIIDEKAENRTRRELHVAAVTSHPTANFTEARSYVEALLRNLGIEDFTVKSTSHPSFIDGRAAEIRIEEKRIGIVGEIHPEVLNNFDLENPTGAFEINLEHLMERLSRKTLYSNR